MYGSYLLAIYDEDQEEFQTISKIGTGFSEELLKELHAKLDEHVIAGPRNYYRWAPLINLTQQQGHSGSIWLDGGW